MKRVLVTGADGFIGSHLTEMLLQKDYKVRALSFYNSFNYNGWIEEFTPNPNLEIVSGDIRDQYFVRNIMRDMETVFHLAALIAIPYSYIAPESYLETNVRGTLNICQAAKEFGGIRVLQTSTSEVYGTAQYVPIDEKHPRQAQSPYSASKIAADAIAMSFYNSYNLPLTIVRPFNTYGPRQSARAIIPTIITQIAKGMNSLSIGDLTPTRDFNFVKDICAGFIAVSECAQCIGKEMNISSNTEFSINGVLQIIKGIMNCDIQVLADIQRMRPKSSEVYRLVGDNKLITDLTGWYPKYSMEEGLKETVLWFSNPVNLKKYKPELYNL